MGPPVPARLATPHDAPPRKVCYGRENITVSRLPWVSITYQKENVMSWYLVGYTSLCLLSACLAYKCTGYLLGKYLGWNYTIITGSLSSKQKLSVRIKAKTKLRADTIAQQLADEMQAQTVEKLSCISKSDW